MIIHDYDYKELEKKALSPEATQTDIDNLGKWFDLYGTMYWNGEYFEIDREHRLFPVWKETEPDEFEIVGYKIR